VVAHRAAAAILAQRGPVAPRPLVSLREPLPLVPLGPKAPVEAEIDRASLRRAVQAGAGVARDADGLGVLAAYLSAPRARSAEATVADRELANMVPLARAVVALAERRCESRGAHWRTDFPEPRPEWRVRQVAQMGECGDVAVGNLEVAMPGVTAEGAPVSLAGLAPAATSGL